MNSNIPSDVIGVIATFLPPTTCHQQRLMLVNNTWYQGVVQQDGMKPKPNINWPLDAMKHRKPSSLRLRKTDDDTADHMRAITTLCAVDKECGHFVEHLWFPASLSLPDEAYHLLPKFARLTGVNVFNMKDDTLKLLVKLVGSQLTHLSVSHRKTMSCGGFLDICHQCTNLIELHVGSSLRKIKDDEFSHIVKLKNLQVLRFNNCHLFTDSTMKYLSSLEHLSVCCLRSLQSDAFTNEGLALLAQKKHGRPITELQLNGNKTISEEGIQHFTSLTSLSLMSCDALSTQLGVTLSKLSFLVELNISGSRLPRGSLEGIGTLAQLQTLIASVCEHLGDLDLEHVSTCTNLTRLEITCWENLTDNGMKHVANLKELETFSVCAPALTFEGLQHLKSLQRLKKLCIESMDGVNDALLEDVVAPHHSDLRSLSIDDCCNVTDAGVIAVVTNCKFLTCLRLGFCINITDASVKLFATHLPNLEELCLCQTGVTDEIAAELVEQLADLKQLNLFDCPGITAAGVSHIRTLHRLCDSLRILSSW